MPLKAWFWIHNWTSLICTAFLLLLCLTGLPLIFADEIDAWLDDEPAVAVAPLPADAPRLSLDGLVQKAHALARAALDTITAGVLGSGLYLWFARRLPVAARR